MHLLLIPFLSAILSPAELINLPFIPKSCSSVQEVTHAAPRKGSVLLDWVMNYSHTIVYCETLGCKAERYKIHLIPNKKTYIELLLFLLQWSL